MKRAEKKAHRTDQAGVAAAPRLASFYIGWDVGGWNCDKNSKSRDAIVILDVGLSIVGTPWRGNLRNDINESATATEWIGALFACCGANPPNSSSRVVLAIDTPLGFSQEFVRLVSERRSAGPMGNSEANSYLFRQTERHLFGKKLKPLSPVKDMLGSQATKGMHALSKFAPTIQSCGIWTDGASLVAIEAYPSACKKSATIKALRAPFGKHSRQLDHPDKRDALTCALLAFLFSERRDALEGPADEFSMSEGWIWVPNDV